MDRLFPWVASLLYLAGWIVILLDLMVWRPN